MNANFILYFIVPLVLGTGITLAGAVLLFVDARRKMKEVDTGDWLVVGGKVTSVQPDGARYVYVINGTELKGESALPQKHSFSENAYVPVRYNPKNPAESVLDNQPVSTNYLSFFGWLFAAFGVVSCCFTGLMAVIVLGAAQ